MRRQVVGKGANRLSNSVAVGDRFLALDAIRLDVRHKPFEFFGCWHKLVPIKRAPRASLQSELTRAHTCCDRLSGDRGLPVRFSFYADCIPLSASTLDTIVSRAWQGWPGRGLPIPRPASLDWSSAAGLRSCGGWWPRRGAAAPAPRCRLFATARRGPTRGPFALSSRGCN